MLYLSDMEQMNAEIRGKINEILVELVDDDKLVLTEEMGPGDIEGWDSLVHFQLVSRLQQEFNIKFSIIEIQTWTTVGNIINTIKNKQ